MTALEAALAYRSRGFSVLPLKGKAPHTRLIQRTHGFKSTRRLAAQGATDEQVRDWFSRANANVGVFCGEPSDGLVVVDLDDCEFPLQGATLPLTPLVKTGRNVLRGYHLYYRSSDHVVSRDFGWGEVRANAPQYVVAPPSVHPTSGRRYAWMLAPDELELSDFSDLLLPQLSEHLEPTSTNNGIRPTKDVLLRPCTTGDTGREGWLEGFDRDPVAVAQMARALGITAPLGMPFRCVLHSERNPSAALYLAPETGVWLYHDFHAQRHGSTEWLPLASVRAALAGRPPKLAGPELATWKLVLLVEAGALPLVRVPAAPLPEGTAAVLMHVYERFLFLLGCRWNYTYGAPAPFTREFAAALCEITAHRAREAIDALEAMEAIRVVATQPRGVKRLRLWLPTGLEAAAGTATREHNHSQLRGGEPHERTHR